jgi:hypothetical protein
VSVPVVGSASVAAAGPRVWPPAAVFNFVVDSCPPEVKIVSISVLRREAG